MPTPPPRSRPAAPPVALPGWAALCFFISGVAGLVYEVVWSKELSYILGNSLHSVATVLAAFLGGLGIGARFLGVPLARRGNGARTYAMLELTIGALGLVSLPVLRGMEPLVGELYRWLGGEGPAFAAARFGLLFALLLPPAAFMGATFPILVGTFERARVGSVLARLYALNMLGAVVGSAASGFVFLPLLGLTKATWVAAALNLAAGIIALRARSEDRGDAVPSRRAPEVAPRPSPAMSGGAHGVLALLFALSGFAALVYQIAWVRLFGLVFGTSVYSLSAVLTLYLLGLGLGSHWVARSIERGASVARFARLQIALAVITALELFLFARLPDWMYVMAERAGTRWGLLFTWELGVTALLVLPPCVLLGAVFPLATRLLQRRDRGHATGFAYGVNTLGTISGTLFAGFFALPTWGVQGTYLGAALLSTTIGISAFALSRALGESLRRDLALAVGAVVVVCGLAAAAPRWDPSLMTSGVFRPVQATQWGNLAELSQSQGPTVWRATRLQRVLYYHEGINGSVLVGSDPQDKSRWLRVGGKPDASTREDMGTQILLGLIPAACADSGSRALVIGLGSGMTAAAVLAAGAGPTDVVEIEPEVVKASRFFHETGESPLDDPRVRLVQGDARTHLEHSGRRYGVIVSEPSNPWIAGINNLFTVDFYRRVRASLEPDGVFCQWMQLYELSPETFAVLARSFLEVFPDGEVFSVWRSADVLLIAMPQARRLDLARLQTPAIRRLLDSAKLGPPDGLAGFYAGPLRELRTTVEAAPLNLDDRPIAEYRAPRELVAVGRGLPDAHVRVAALLPRAEATVQAPLFEAWTPEEWYESRVRLQIQQRAIAVASATAGRAELSGHAELARRLRDEIVVSERRARAQEAVDMARAFFKVGREAEGQKALERATELDPANRSTWLILANHRLAVGNVSGAEAAVAHGMGSEDRVIAGAAETMAGRVSLARRRPAEAARHFVEAEHLDPDQPMNHLLEIQAHLAAGDRKAARQALQRGLQHFPSDPGLTGAMASVGLEN